MLVISVSRFQSQAGFLLSAKLRLLIVEGGGCWGVGAGCDTPFFFFFFSGIRSNSTAGMLLIFFWQPACVGLGGGEGA